MARKAVAIRHAACADPGFFLDVLKQAGYTIEVVGAPDSEPGALHTLACSQMVARACCGNG